MVIPCLNEAENIAECVRRAPAVLAENGLDGEVVVVDNGSEDGSGEIARAAGARVVDEPRRGYGQAYQAGFDAARGDYIVMIDADLTYDFEEIPRFVEQLDDGAELVMGNRMQNVEPGAMSLAEPDREPDPLRLPERSLPDTDRRRPLRDARDPPRRRCHDSTCARPGWSSPPRW